MDHLICPLFKGFRIFPTQIALTTPTEQWSYRELHEKVDRVAKDLAVQGIFSQSRVAFIASPSPDSLILLFALFRLGAIACLLNERTPQTQRVHHLQRFSATHYISKTQVIPYCRQHKQISLQTPDVEIPLDRYATFLLTSGSSGFPKVVCHDVGNHFYNALGVLRPLHIDPSTRYLLSLPLYHVSGISLCMRTWLAGGTIVMTTQPLLQALATQRITHLSVVPTQLYRLLNDPLFSVTSSLRCVLVGGAPIPMTLLSQACAKGLPICTTFGMTETSSIATLSTHPELNFRQIKIDEAGELWVRGRVLFRGYWESAQQKCIRQEKEGWFPTQDLGKWDPVHGLQITGRKDRQFISGGENIQPEEIEQVLLTFPGIQAATILAQEDAEFGARPVAFIKTLGLDYTLKELKTLLSPLLPSFKHPIALFPYPENGEGKVSLQTLKDSLHKISCNTAGTSIED